MRRIIGGYPINCYSISASKAYAIVILSSVLITTAAVRSQTINFNIPAQPLSTALAEYARQADVQLAYLSRHAERVRANAVSGDYSRQVALNLLLADTGFTGKVSADFTVTVQRLDDVSTSLLPVAHSLIQRTERTAIVGPDRTPQMRQGNTGGASSDSPRDTDEKPQELSRVTVTGTQIRGVGPVGANVITIDREEIDRTGLATIPQVLNTLTQNFQGGPTEKNDLVSNPGNQDNNTFGSGVNLRGLGAEATLVLVNGRRQASSGRAGGFVDVSSIPLIAVDRVEVLPDGASAIHGSDAVGGVINVILRDDFNGAQSTLYHGPDLGVDFEQYKFGQIVGTTWETGNFIAVYEYQERGALKQADRDFLATGDLTAFGGDNFNTDFGNPGTIISLATFQPFAIPASQDGTSLSFSDLMPGVINEFNVQKDKDFLPRQMQQSLYFLISQDVSRNFEFFAEGRYRNRDFELAVGNQTVTLLVPTTNAFIDNAFGASVNGTPVLPVVVRYSLEDDLGTVRLAGDAESIDSVIGGVYEFQDTWHLNFHANYNTENGVQNQLNLVNSAALNQALSDSEPTTAFNPFGDGSNTSPATIQDIRSAGFIRETEYTVESINTIVTGAVFSLGGDDARLAAGLNFREEDYQSEAINNTVPLPSDEIGRNVSAAFAELYLPVVHESSALPLTKTLQFSIAARYEDYSDFGNTTNPKIGASWAINDHIRVRGTFGSSYRAPLLTELIPNEFAVITNVDDPSSTTGSTRGIVRAGNNPSLTEETADSITVGIDLVPPIVPNFTVSFDYFDIEFSDRIQRPGRLDDILFDEEGFSSIIIRDPNQSEIDDICTSQFFLSNPAECTPEFIGVIVDTRLNNTSIVKTRGVDISASYNANLDVGSLNFTLRGTYLTEYAEAFSDRASLAELLNTPGNPLDFRMRGSVSWGVRDFRLSGFITHADGYSDDRNDYRDVESYTTVDATFAYETDGEAKEGFLGGWNISLSLFNIFDEEPPFVNVLGGHDSTNADVLGRSIALRARKNW